MESHRKIHFYELFIQFISNKSYLAQTNKESWGYVIVEAASRKALEIVVNIFTVLQRLYLVYFFSCRRAAAKQKFS